MTATATAEKSNASSSLSFDALLAKVRELSPFLSEQAVVGEKQGQLTEATIHALRQAGVFAAFVPKALGGAELWPSQGIEIIETLSRADGSAGWVFMATQVAMATCGAYLAPAAAKTVFANHIPLIAGQGAPVGVANSEQNGYRLSGKWSYGSGLLHSEWIHTGAVVHRNGSVVLHARNQRPETRILIVPVAKARLTNNWDVLGLRSTGSIDYSMQDVFVSGDFTHLLSANRPLTGGDLYRVGILGFAAIGHSGFALGIARRTLDEIAALATSAAGRPTPVASPGGGDNFQLQYGRAEGQLYAARAFVFDVWNDIQRRTRKRQRSDRASNYARAFGIHQRKLRRDFNCQLRFRIWRWCLAPGRQYSALFQGSTRCRPTHHGFRSCHSRVRKRSSWFGGREDLDVAAAGRSVTRRTCRGHRECVAFDPNATC